MNLIPGCVKDRARIDPSPTELPRGSSAGEGFMSKNKVLLIYILLTVATLAAFWQVTRCDFISLDDPLYVTENPHIANGITAESVRWAFNSIYAGFWHPLTMISLMLDVQLFGSNPHGYHLTNLLFHIASTLLLFFVLNRMTNAPWRSAFVAALFALHPLHVESVAWVAERKDVLSAFFWMLTLAAYVFYVERPRLRTYLCVLALFIMGLMAKPMLVTLPFIMLLLDYWPLQRLGAGSGEQEARSRDQGAASKTEDTSLKREAFSANKRKRKSPKKPADQALTQSSVLSPQSFAPGPQSFPFGPQSSVLRLIVEKIPFFVPILLFSVLTYTSEGEAVGHYPLGVRISNALVSYVLYIAKMFWPARLAVYYPYHWTWPFWQPAGCAFLLFAVTVTVILTAKRFPYLATGWMWFAGALVPVIGIVQIGSFEMADRYTYIPLIGLFIMVAWGVPELLERRHIRREILFPVSGLILVCLSIVTWTQAGYWTNSISLYDHTLKVTLDNYFIYNNRAIVNAQSGNYVQAIADFNKAIEINTDSPDAFFNRGNAYARLGNNTLAIADFTRAIEINSQDARVYKSRGIAYHKLGKNTPAIEDYDKAIELEPESADAHCNRGNAWYDLGDYEHAISDYDKAIEIDPKIALAYANRANLYDKLGNYGQAKKDMKTAADLGSEEARHFLNIQKIRPGN
ncbi:putative TPR domain protein [Syntrophobacter sp. SbD1]|nr:putative TPR domain protein [Syntrophobacter sp. SbD1]